MVRERTQRADDRRQYPDEPECEDGQCPAKPSGRSRDAAYGKTVWSRHPLLVSSRRRSVDPTGSEQSFNPSVTEARRIRLRGELGISRQTIAQGMSDALRCPVCSCASHHSFAHETAGAARTRHSLRPLSSRGAEITVKLRAPRAARSRSHIRVVTASLRTLKSEQFATNGCCE
jgi:hypothetical protein